MELKYIAPKIRKEENTVVLMCFFLEKVLANSRNPPSEKLPKYSHQEVNNPVLLLGAAAFTGFGQTEHTSKNIVCDKQVRKHPQTGAFVISHDRGLLYNA